MEIKLRGWSRNNSGLLIPILNSQEPANKLRLGQRELALLQV